MSSESDPGITPQISTVSWADERDNLRRIRDQVFIQEQGVPQDIEWDGKDEHSIHLLATIDGRAVGCGRLMPDGKIGRMAVLAEYRNCGVGSAVIRAMIDAASGAGYRHLYLHAQQHALPFYRHFGFEPRGATFEEAGIPHITMHLSLEADSLPE